MRLVVRERREPRDRVKRLWLCWTATPLEKKFFKKKLSVDDRVVDPYINRTRLETFANARDVTSKKNQTMRP